jgi:nucleotide-binding universal stress UspA family protein
MEHTFRTDGIEPIVDGARHRPLFIIGVDGSESGRTALRQAAQEAGELGARILCVHVRPRHGAGELMACFAPGAVLISRECRDEVEAQAWLDCVLTLEPTGLDWGFAVATGRPERRLREVAVAEHAAAVFVGRLPRRTWSRWFHRCPARRLLRSHACPVRLVTLPAPG